MNTLRACSHGSGGPQRGEVTCGKEILVFTCNPGDAGWGPKCNYFGAKHAHKQRTIVYSDEAAFRLNVVVSGKTLVWFSWLARPSDSTPKFGGFGGEIVEITHHARVIWLRRLGGLPHPAAFTWRKLIPPKRVTRTGWPGNPPWWSPNQEPLPGASRDQEKKREIVWIDWLPHQGGGPHLPAWGPPL